MSYSMHFHYNSHHLAIISDVPRSPVMIHEVHDNYRAGLRSYGYAVPVNTPGMIRVPQWFTKIILR